MQGASNILLNLDRLQLEQYFNKEEIAYIYEDENIFDRLMRIASDNKINVSAEENLIENVENYNEMGLIQAIDNISAIEVIKDNGFKFNKDKIILYGHSHGAYLSYLCNALAPNLFSLLIDNSSWLFPAYLKNNRYLNSMYRDSMLSVEFDYLAKTLNYDEEILYLPSLYKKFDNQFDIICYHGTNDNLISHRDKVKLKKIIKNFRYNEIDDNKVDNMVFKSTQHGLDADFLELFDYTMKKYKFKFEDRIYSETENIYYETKKNKYSVNYDSIVPVLNLDRK